jgi:phosphatidylserine decarboxylase
MILPISKYGHDIVLIVGVITLLAVGIAFYVEIGIFRLVLGVVFGPFFLFALYFFRDPERRAPAGENLVVSPADGKIVQIETVRDKSFLKADAIQVSIFMSPFNVHVNRVPMSGTVGYFQYIPGDYIVAFEDKASERNERTLIGIDNGKWKVLFKQIAGFVARRIVCELKLGDDVTKGERFGMIRFGSRVDVMMPISTEIKVRLNDSVRAGESVLGILH